LWSVLKSSERATEFFPILIRNLNLGLVHSNCTESHTDVEEIGSHAARVWISILTETQDLYVSDVEYVLDSHIRVIRTLMAVRNAHGRAAVDVATPRYK